MPTPRSTNSSARFSLPPRGASGPWNGDASASVQGPALGEAGHAGGEQEGAVGPDQRVADGLDGGPLGGGGRGRVGPVVLVREVNDGLGVLGPGPDAPEVVEVTAADAGPLGLEGGGGSVGPGQAGDLVSGG